MQSAKGQWVFVPAPKWETLPPSVYSLRGSTITCALFFRTDYARRKWCVDNNVLPPSKLRKGRTLDEWIDRKIRASERKKARFAEASQKIIFTITADAGTVPAHESTASHRNG